MPSRGPNFSGTTRNDSLVAVACQEFATRQSQHSNPEKVPCKIPGDQEEKSNVKRLSRSAQVPFMPDVLLPQFVHRDIAPQFAEWLARILRKRPSPSSGDRDIPVVELNHCRRIGLCRRGTSLPKILVLQLASKLRSSYCNGIQGWNRFGWKRRLVLGAFSSKNGRIVAPHVPACLR